MMPGFCWNVELFMHGLISVSRSTNTQLICNLFPLWLLGHEVVCPFFMPYLDCKE